MKRRLNLSLLALVLSLVTSLETIAQQIAGPEFYINDSNATDKNACVNQNIPNRSAIAEYNGPSGFFGANTEFFLEISDETGVFSDQTTRTLDRFVSSTAIGASADIDFVDFPIPRDLRGDNYSLRIRAELPDGSEFIGISTTNAAIYYFDFSQGVTLTGPNLDANNVALCQGEPVTLTAQPEGFPAYIWSRDGTVIPGESSNILENVTQPGFYNVKIDFGFCNPFFNFDSANTNVFLFDTNTVFINEEAASPLEFCPEAGNFLTCSITDPAYTYEWFLDGESIADSDSFIYELPMSNFAGDYTVMVTARDGCSIMTNPVEVINLGSDILTQPPPQLIILPTETITLAITTNAPAGSTIQWYENDVMIPRATGLSIDVTSIGAYEARVLTNDICMSELVARTEVFVAESFKPTVSQVIDCDDNIATLALEELLGITSAADGSLEIPLTTEQYNFFDFEWFRDGTGLGETELTYTVDGVNENDSYTLEATFRPGGFPTAVSDPVMIDFLTDEIEIVSDPPFLSFGGEVTLSAPLSSLYIYEWFVDTGGGFQLIEGENTNQLVVSEEGNYRVVIMYQDCIAQGEITVGDEPGVSALIPNAIAPNSDSNDIKNWVLPDEFESSDVEVTIYSSNGKLDFQKAGGYNEDWPSNSASGASELIYYYIITRSSAVVRKGTITVMR